MYLSNCLHLTIAQESEDVDDEDASHKVGDSLPWVGLKSRLFAGLIYLGFFLTTPSCESLEIVRT